MIFLAHEKRYSRRQCPSSSWMTRALTVQRVWHGAPLKKLAKLDANAVEPPQMVAQSTPRLPRNPTFVF